MNKFKGGWGQKKIKSGNTGNLVREVLREKTKLWFGIIDMERECYYNRNGWRIESREVMGHRNESFEKDLINRERDLQRQGKENR